MMASDARELTDVANVDELTRFEDRRLGLRIALEGIRPEQYQDARELKIRAPKAAQMAVVERWLPAMRQERLF